MPTEVSERVGLFDQFAGRATDVSSRAAFFTFCLLLVVLWMPSIAVIRNVDTWQLVINTLTTVITFLMVALLQNSETRSDQAIQHKLNALSVGLADVMDHLAGAAGDEDLARDRRELLAGVGLEDIESTDQS